MKSPRWRKRLIALIYHAIIFAVAVAGIKTNNNWMVAIGIFDLLTFRLFPISNFIQSILVNTAHCSNCQETINLKSFWGCSCGYAPPIPRHIFLPCPQCGKTFSFVTCSCGAGILV